MDQISRTTYSAFYANLVILEVKSRFNKVQFIVTGTIINNICVDVGSVLYTKVNRILFQ